jgi:hypothetical protein
VFLSFLITLVAEQLRVWTLCIVFLNQTCLDCFPHVPCRDLHVEGRWWRTSSLGAWTITRSESTTGMRWVIVIVGLHFLRFVPNVFFFAQLCFFCIASKTMLTYRVHVILFLFMWHGNSLFTTPFPSFYPSNRFTSITCALLCPFKQPQQVIPPARGVDVFAWQRDRRQKHLTKERILKELAEAAEHRPTHRYVCVCVFRSRHHSASAVQELKSFNFSIIYFWFVEATSIYSLFSWFILFCRYCDRFRERLKKEDVDRCHIFIQNTLEDQKQVWNSCERWWLIPLILLLAV